MGVALRSTSDTFGSVVHLVVPGDERRSLLCEPVIVGIKFAAVAGSLTIVRILSAMNSHHSRVRLRIEQQVGVVTRQLREAGAVPHLLVERPPLFARIVEGRAIVRRVQEPAHRRVQRLAYRFEVGAQPSLLVGSDRRVVERRAPVGGALVHRQRRDFSGDGRNQLNATRSGPDDGDALAREVDGVRRPQSGVVRLPAKVVAPRYVREVRHRQDAGRGNEESCSELCAVVDDDCPQAFRFVVSRRRHHGVEPDVAAKVEAVDDVIEVALGFRLFARSALATPTRRTARSRTNRRTCSSRSRTARPGSDSSTRCRRRHRRPRATGP